MDEFSNNYSTEPASHLSPMLARPDDDDDQYDYNGLDSEIDGTKLDLSLGSAVVDALDERLQDPEPSFLNNDIVSQSHDDRGLHYDADSLSNGFHQNDRFSDYDSSLMPSNYDSLEYPFDMATTDYFEQPASSSISYIAPEPANFVSAFSGSTETSMVKIAVTAESLPAETVCPSVHTSITSSDLSLNTVQETSGSVLSENAPPELKNSNLIETNEKSLESASFPRPTSFLADGEQSFVLQPDDNTDRAAWNSCILVNTLKPVIRIEELDSKILKKLKSARQLPEQIRKDEKKRQQKAEKKANEAKALKHDQKPSTSDTISKKRKRLGNCIVCKNQISSDSNLSSDSLYCNLDCIQKMVERCRPCCLPAENLTFMNASNELAQLPKKTVVTISTLNVFLQAKPMLKPFVNFAKLNDTSKTTASQLKAEKDLKDEDRIRANVKITIRDQLMERAKNLKIGVSRKATTTLAEQIEVELYRLHKYAKAKRYKEWIQDFFAQVLDDNNMFFKKVVTNGYTAQKLVLMKKSEMFISPADEPVAPKPAFTVAPKVSRPKPIHVRPMVSAVDKILGEEGADTTMKHNSHEYDSNCQICAKKTAARKAALEQAEKDREEELEERKRRKALREQEREERAKYIAQKQREKQQSERGDEDPFDSCNDPDDFRPVSPSRSSNQNGQWRRNGSPQRSKRDRSRREAERDSGRHRDTSRNRYERRESYDRGYSLTPRSPMSPPPQMNPTHMAREMTPPPGVSPDRLAVKHVGQRESNQSFAEDRSPDMYGSFKPNGPSRSMPNEPGYDSLRGSLPAWTPGMPEFNDRSYPPDMGPAHMAESWRREEQWRRDGRPEPSVFTDVHYDGLPHGYRGPSHHVHPRHYDRPISPVLLRPSPPSMRMHGSMPFPSASYRPQPGHLFPNGHPMERYSHPGYGPPQWHGMRRSPTPEFVLEPIEPRKTASHIPNEPTPQLAPIWRQDPIIFNGTISGVSFNFRCIMRVISNPAAFELRDKFPNPLKLKARVRPEPMWTFLKSVKHIRRFQTIVATLHIASSADAEPYFCCLDNLKQHSRYAVFDLPTELGIKEAYLFYLDAGEPLPPILLPVDGPGLPSMPMSKGCLCTVIVKYAEVKPTVSALVSSTGSPASLKSGSVATDAQNVVKNEIFGNESGHQTLQDVLAAIENIQDPAELIKIVKGFIKQRNVTEEEKSILQNKCTAKIEEQRRLSTLGSIAPAMTTVKSEPISSVQIKDEVQTDVPMELDEAVSVAAMSSGSIKTDSTPQTFGDSAGAMPLQPSTVPAKNVEQSPPEEGEMIDDDAMDISDDNMSVSAPIEFVLPPPPPPPTSEALAPPPPPPPPLPYDSTFNAEEMPMHSQHPGMFHPSRSPYPSRSTLGFFNNASTPRSDVDQSPRGRGRGHGMRGTPRGHPRGPQPFSNRFPPPSNWQGPSPSMLPPQNEAFMFHGGRPSRTPVPLNAIGQRPPSAFRGGRGNGRGRGRGRGSIRPLF